MTPTSIGAPVISNIVKGPTGASFDFAAVPKAAQYVITRYKNGVAQTPTITRLPSDPKAVSFTLAAPTDADAYSWQVVAVTAGGVQSVPGTTGSLTVGIAGAPVWALSDPVVPSVGLSTLTWTSEAYNARIGTSYFLQLFDASDATVGGRIGPLSVTGSGTGPYTASVTVAPAGSYKYQLVPVNINGDGTPSARTATAISSRECACASPIAQPLGQKQKQKPMPLLILLTCLPRPPPPPQHFPLHPTSWVFRGERHRPL